MPATRVDYSKVEEARKKAERAGKAAAERVGLGNTFEQRLRSRLKEQRVSEGASRLEEMAGSAWEAYSGAPSTIQETYPDLTPAAYTQGVGARQANIMGDIGRIAAMQRSRQRGIQDIIGGITAGIQAETQRQQQMAQAAQRAYENLFGQYTFGREQALAQQQLQLKRGQMDRPSTAGERLREGATENLKADIKNWASLEDLMRTYKDVLGFSDIYRLYNQLSPWGPAEKSIKEYRRIYDASAGGSGDMVLVGVDEQGNPIYKEPGTTQQTAPQVGNEPGKLRRAWDYLREKLTQ